MSREIDNNDGKNQELVDPISLVPNEIATKFLSFLSPSSIATSSAVSLKWRTFIHSNSTLHKDIDLTKMGLDSDPEQLLLHLNRLSSLALNRVVRMSLNISSIFKLFEFDPKGVGFKTLFQLSKALQNSRDSIQEIYLVIKSPKEKKYREDQMEAAILTQIIPFLLLVLRKLRTFKNLSLVEVRAPVGATMKAGKAGSKRRVSVINNFSFDESQKSLIHLVEEVEHLADSGFIEFKFSNYSRVIEARKIMQVLEGRSRFHLETLDFSQLSSNSRGELANTMWDLAMACENLISLTLALTPLDGREIQIMRLKEGQSRRTGKLKALNLSIYPDHQIDVKMVSQWIGNQLEEVKLNLQENQQNQFMTFDSFSSSIVPSRETLKAIVLVEVGLQEAEAVSTTFNPHYPNLEELSLTDCSEFLLRFFSQIESPKLCKLSLNSRTKATMEDTVSCLLKLLVKYQSELLYLRFGHPEEQEFQPPNEAFHFCFDKLEHFAPLGRLIDPMVKTHQENAFINWVSQFKFPSLTSIHPEWSYYPKFKRTSPKLIPIKRMPWQLNDEGEMTCETEEGKWSDEE